MLKLFFDIFFKISSAALTAVSVVWKHCPQSFLFSVGNKNCSRALDLGGWRDIENPFTWQNLNDNVQNVVWHCYDEASSSV
jgi:hypothetical protein